MVFSLTQAIILQLGNQTKKINKIPALEKKSKKNIETYNSSLSLSTSSSTQTPQIKFGC